MGGQVRGAYDLNKPPGWNLVRKHKTIKFDVVREGPATKYIQISWKGWKEWKNYIASNHSPYFLKIPKWRDVRHHLTFQPEIVVFPWNYHSIITVLTTLCTKRTALPDSSYEVVECLINIGFLFCTSLNVLNLLKTKRIWSHYCLQFMSRNGKQRTKFGIKEYN